MDFETQFHKDLVGYKEVEFIQDDILRPVPFSKKRVIREKLQGTTVSFWFTIPYRIKQRIKEYEF